jgi:AGCS family alanine or glycine:cation symporter
MKHRSAVALLSLVLAAFLAPLAVPAPAAAQPATAETAQAQPPGGGPSVDTEQTAGGAEAPPVATSEESQPGIMGSVDRAMGAVNGVISAFFFYDVLFWDAAHQLPLVVLWLVLGAIFFTFKMGFINFRGFGHAVQVVRGKYSDPNDAGEVSHFQALSTALSATVGLGNIAGVAIAIAVGGPGATFWMIIAGLLGMSSKFAECTLGQQYREVRSDGRIMGGAMEYLSKGLKEKGWPRLGMFLAVMFSILCIGGSLGGGNSFQVNQSLNAMQETLPFLAARP